MIVVSLLSLFLLAVPVLTAALSTAFTHVRTIEHRFGDQPWQHYNQSEFAYHGQRVDHFNLVDNRNYTQRFFTIDQFWAGPHAPVIFSLCGEYTCPGLIPSRLFPLQLAYEFGALVVIAEHRYYGRSFPTNATTDNLYLLNSRQGINDFAYFQQWFQQTQINEQFGTNGGNRWLVVGGSYPGALSAWYRLKFPHLVVGSIASSAVVEAVLDFPAFDGQVATSAGDECAAALRNITHLIEAAMPAIKTDFQCRQNINDGDFLFLVADAAVEGVQYGGRTRLCETLLPTWRRMSAITSPNTLNRHAKRLASIIDLQDQLLALFVNYTINVFYAGGNSCDGYDRRSLLDTSGTNDGRSWQWQTCTEVGYWQVARSVDVSIRSQRVNRQYYVDLCREVFGLTTLPDIDGTNNYYGGWNLSTSNTFFINGVEDPWQHASVTHSLAPTVSAVVVNCTDCAHCVEEYTPTDGDAPVLKQTRARITEFVKKLLL